MVNGKETIEVDVPEGSTWAAVKALVKFTLKKLIRPDAAANLQDKIQTKVGAAPHEQKLMYKSKAPKDDQSLEGVKDGAKVFSSPPFPHHRCRTSHNKIQRPGASHYGGG